MSCKALKGTCTIIAGSLQAASSNQVSLVAQHNGPRHFSFDHVIDQSGSQQDVFQGARSCMC
jgi:hypothetical protein